MQREIRLTSDGSHTIALAGTQVTYHSHHGAIAESMHVFIDAGFRFLLSTRHRPLLTVLEVGMGTGLNALLTLREALAIKQKVRYIAIETDPLQETEFSAINHGALLGVQTAFENIHRCPWEKECLINDDFILHKKNISLLDLVPTETVDCIYFDAFAPTDQPELWTEDVFTKLRSMLAPDGVLVTYSSKSSMRRAMTAAGFRVTKIPGPMGKRDMVRAFRG